MAENNNQNNNQSNKLKRKVFIADPNVMPFFEEEEGVQKSSPEEEGLLPAILKSLNKQERKTVRMAFDVDPYTANQVGALGMYYVKTNLTPDPLLKRIAGVNGDELVNQILQARSNIVASFGRPRTSRFSIGFELEEITEATLNLSPEEKEKIVKRLDYVKKFLWNCGDGLAVGEHTPINLSQFLKMITRDGLTYGRICVERLYTYKLEDGELKEVFYGFRPVDSGTIYYVVPSQQHDPSLRVQAIELLSQLKNEKLDPEKYKRDEYVYMQVINGRPTQAFTAKELIWYNLYPTTNVEYNRYPLTPIDQALNAITTHINITIHNKLYFQHGRAARGMLVIKSDSVDDGAVQQISRNFHQSINSVQNSWRMPVFAVSPNEDITWQPIEMSGRDAEFQYLSDNNARVILSAFQMSPEELPGYAHLARGTNTQALAESNNEWKLTAARDVGLRPLLNDIQDLFNTHILPEIDPEIAKYYKVVFAGLEQDSPEKEATRLQQDMTIHMTYNDVLEAVEKPLLPEELGGKFPLNPAFQQVIFQHLTVGEILENFFNRKGASKDPRFQYVRDPFWFQYQNMMLQKAQIMMQQQMMMQQQAMQQQMSQMQGQDEGQNQDYGQALENEDYSHEEDFSQLPPLPTGNPEEDQKKMEEWLFSFGESLNKAVKSNHTKISKILLNRQRQLVDTHLKNWKKKTKEALDKMQEVLKNADKDDETE
jgi:hypothetical protein